MLKTLSITLQLFMLLSIIAPNNAAAALPCNPKILNACYDSCKKLFSDPILQTSCYAGCLIGCVTSGID